MTAPRPTDWASFLEGQLSAALGLIERTGETLKKDAAIVGEYGGNEEQLRDIVLRYARVGEAMLDAVERTEKAVEDYGREESAS